MTTAPKSMRYPGIHLTKEVKDLYPKNHGTHLKEIEEDTKRWKTIPCSWIGRIHILGKCQRDWPRAIYTLIAIPIIKNTKGSLQRVATNHLKISVESDKTPNAQGNIRKENHSWRHHNAGFQVVLPTSAHQDSVVQAQKQTHRSMGQKREIQKWTLNSIVKTIYSTKQERPSTGKKTASSLKAAGNVGQPHAKEWNWTILSHHTQR